MSENATLPAKAKKPDHYAVPVTITLPPHLLNRVDAAAGERRRSRFISSALSDLFRQKDDRSEPAISG